MEPKWFAIVGLALLAWIGAVPTPKASADSLPSFAEWRAACRALPSNRVLGGRMPPKDRLPLKDYAAFAAALDPVLEHCRTGALARADAWVGGAPDLATFLDPGNAYFLRPSTPFVPFAECHRVSPGIRLFFHGDLHGDIHSLLAYLDRLESGGHLQDFRLSRPDLRLVFLGDYTDRGKYGVEVLYTLLRLKLANPEQVLLVRGNHEDVTLVARYGFLAEISAKYGREFDVPRTLRLYDFLPSVLYLASGTNVVQCNHGGVEPGFDPGTLLEAPRDRRFQRLGVLKQRRFLADEKSWIAGLPDATRRALESGLTDFVPESPTTPTVLGFLWNDFTAVAGEPQFAVDPGRAYVYGDETTRRVLARASGPGHRVRAIFRGHQHAADWTPVMRRLVAGSGVFRHWQSRDRPELLNAPPETLSRVLETAEERPIPDGSVWTFNVSPDSVYGAGCGFAFDTAGELVV
ncbi:MAG: serine/threonine protein phosphatase, partial [Verrucomicrobiales bacterium]|nr:serine/threonine protein phosphatase [Verrucomicrobiales bacterium]